MHHHEERLLERIADPVCLFQQDVQGVLDLLGRRRGTTDAFVDVDRMLADSPFVRPVGQQVFRQSTVQVHQRVAVELCLANVFDKKFDGRLVVQDHLGFDSGFATGRFPMVNEFARIETRIGISFQMARRPRQIDEQAIQYGPAVGACRCFDVSGAPHPLQLAA